MNDLLYTKIAHISLVRELVSQRDVAQLQVRVHGRELLLFELMMSVYV